MLLFLTSLWLEIAIVLALSVALTICAAKEGIEFGVFLLIGAIAVHDWFAPADRDAWRFIIAHWPAFAAGLVAYTPIGCCWSLFRWRGFVMERKREFDEREQEIRTGRYHVKPRQDEGIEGLIEASRKQFKPDHKQHKRRIICWIVYWPFDGTWYLIHDSLTAFFNAVYRRMAAIYGKITDGAFGSG